MPVKDFNGTRAVRFWACDDKSACSNQSNNVTLTVNPVPDAPVIQPIPDAEVVIGQAFVYDVESTEC